MFPVVISRAAIVLSVAVGFSAAAPLGMSSLAAAEEIRFNRDIRPLLSENCFHCHGPDDETRAAGLRLDRAEQATEYAIIPGDAAGSDLMERITSDDPELRMPPPDSERSLTEEEIERIGKWIDQGAAYQSHWSFVPPRRVEPPPLESLSDEPVGGPGPSDGAAGDGAAGDRVAGDRSVRSPIDRFIQRELQQRGLKASPPADRETLIRRATFDLTGLPPTLEELDQFLNDQSPDAYEQLLDRLLQSEHFGERMASDWLDVARYSDTYGYQVDRDRFVWPWRDWVVRAFNDNLPYDQFITEQLAGDLLPGATSDQILATTFNRLHPQKVEGGSVPEEFRVEYVADRTQTVATGILGLTMECCRCHNHKYDPISQREYYSLSAFFDNIDEAGLYSFFTDSVPTPTLSLPSDQQEQQLSRARRALRAADTAWGEGMHESQRAAQAWAEGEQQQAEIPFAAPLLSLDFEQPPEPSNRAVPGVVGMAVELTGDDGIGTDAGNFRRHDPFSVALWIKTPDVKERAVIFHRSRAWTDAGSRGYQLLLEQGRLSWSLIHFWPGNAIRVRTRQAIPIDRWIHVAVTNDGSSRAAGLSIFVDGRKMETEVVRDSLTKQITGGGGDTITIGERFRDRGFTRGGVDQFHLFDSELSQLEIAWLASGKDPQQWASADAETPTHAESVGKRWDGGTVEQRIDHFRKRVEPRLKELAAERRRARQSVNEVLDAIPEIMVMRELAGARPTHLLRRGMYDQPAEQVEPETPAALNPFPADAPRNRLGLARWLTDPQHPLTSRVAVNRLWQICFGHGLVRTPEDFGTQGSPPTHPQLLDWLACDFIEHGWNVKRMLKQIMLSATYRRSSVPADQDVVERDPSNQWLARFPAHRLPAEMLRDGALAAGGRLVRSLGGAPVKPYELEASFKPSQPDKGAGLYRRSLYTYWKRTGPAPAMLTLDAAKRDVCQVKRERTSSPLQALVLFNGPQYVEAARGLAQQLIDEHSDDSNTALRDAFRLLTSRTPTTQQLELLGSMLAQQIRYFEDHPERARRYLQVGEAPPSADQSPIQLAALTVVVQTLMNFDGSVMKR